MERFYPNFYSYTKSHYEPLTSGSLLKRSESIATAIGTSENKVESKHSNSLSDKHSSSSTNVAVEAATNRASFLRPFTDVFRSARNSSVKGFNEAGARERSDSPSSDVVSGNNCLSSALPWTSYDASSSRELQHSSTSPIMQLGPTVLTEMTCSASFSNPTSKPLFVHNTDNCRWNCSKNSSLAFSEQDVVGPQLVKTKQGLNVIDGTSNTPPSSTKKSKSDSSHFPAQCDRLRSASFRLGQSGSRPLGTKSVRTPSPCVTNKISQNTGFCRLVHRQSSQSKKVPNKSVNNRSSNAAEITDGYKRLRETERIVRQELFDQKCNGCRNVAGKPYFSSAPQTPASKHKFSHKEDDPPCAIVLPIRVQSKALAFDDQPIVGGSRQRMTESATEFPTRDFNSKPNHGISRKLFDPKVREEATLDETKNTLTSKIQQLTTMNTIKDSEICELRNTINQLRSDMHKLQLVHEAQQRRPGRSNSYRTVPENSIQQDIQETISLNSLASGTSNGSQDTTSVVGQTGSDTTATTNSAQSPDTLEHSAGKRSRWIRPTLGKAFKKRSKSSMDTGDRDGRQNDPLRVTNNPTATVFTNIPGARMSLPLPDGRKRGNVDPLKIVSPQIGADQATHELLLKMRWELSYLKADNQRLRRLIANSPVLSDTNNAEHQEVNSTISLTDLSVRHCLNAKQYVQVYIYPEPIPAAGNIQTSEECLLWDIQSRVALTKLLKAGYVGLKEGSTWKDLDNSLSALIHDHLAFLDPEEKLGFHTLAVEAYQLGCRLQTSSNFKTIIRRRSVENPMEFTSDYAQDYAEIQEPLKWLEDILHMENEKVILLHAIVSMAVVTDPRRIQSISPGESVDFNNSQLADFSLVSFETLIPVQLLQHYFSVIQNNQFNILCGPPGTGKLRILRELARELLRSCQSEGSVRTYSIKPGGSGLLGEIKKFFDEVISSGHSVAILEDLHHFPGPIKELLDVICSDERETRPIILATSDVHNEELESLQESNLVGIVQHLTDLDTTTNFLGCYLRRKLAQTRLFEETTPNTCTAASSHEDQALTHLVNWIPKVWNHLNRLFTTPQQKQRSTLFGLRVFLTCPMDLQSSQNWFTDLWNNLFIPFLFRTRSTDQMLCTSTTSTLSASFDWIMATWPWSHAQPDDLTVTGAAEKNLTEPVHLGENPTPTSAQTSFPLVTFGAPKSPQAPVQRQRTLKNRSSLDSGIVPDGYAAVSAACTTQPPFESRLSVGSEISDRITVTDLLAEVTSKSTRQATNARECQVNNRV